MSQVNFGKPTKISGYCGLFNHDGVTFSIQSDERLIVDRDYILKKINKVGVGVPLLFTGEICVFTSFPHVKEQQILFFSNGELTHSLTLTFASRFSNQSGIANGG